MAKPNNEHSCGSGKMMLYIIIDLKCRFLKILVKNEANPHSYEPSFDKTHNG